MTEMRLLPECIKFVKHIIKTRWGDSLCLFCVKAELDRFQLIYSQDKKMTIFPRSPFIAKKKSLRGKYMYHHYNE